jgi:hypothetical protein
MGKGVQIIETDAHTQELELLDRQTNMNVDKKADCREVGEPKTLAGLT